ncbi:hypothetical protein [Streptomyces fructofermentans]|uniref:Uncharacterized protein n=1 Tax=Streptomyces fructofermentans TaxID=152141 RepID=A0A918K1E0_9ACTN|nr:hypothetical protein [Streptomyces fructofermentans]GGX41215.1 hypothetical protein GCM10010515_05160 [Streptomyces fructofermentans]
MTRPTDDGVRRLRGGTRDDVRDDVREGTPPGRGPDVRAEGRWATAVGQVLGNFVVSLVVGDALRNTLDGARSWRVWNWPPFAVVLGLCGVALVRTPEGPAGQFLWVRLALGAAVLIAFVRVAGARGPAAVQALASALSVALAVGGAVRTEQLRVHGEVDVTGLVRVVRPGPLKDGETLTLVVSGGPHRTHLRLVLQVEDETPARQSCTPDTDLAVRLEGGRNTAGDVRSGRPVELPLGGAKGVLTVLVTVRTDKGCSMNVFVDDAVLRG